MAISLPNINIKRTVIFLASFGIFLAIIWGAINAFVNPSKFSDALLAHIKQSSGYDAQVRSTRLTVFPLPSIVIEGLTIENVPEASGSYFLEVPVAEFRLSVPDLMKGQVVPVSLNMEKPDLELERFSSTQSNWEAFFKKRGFFEGLSIAKVTVHNATVVYNYGVDLSEEFTGLDMTATFDGKGAFDIQSDLNAFGRKGKIDITSKSGRFTSTDDFSFDVTSHMTFDTETIDYKGQWGNSPDFGYEWKGHFDATLSSLAEWLPRVMQDNAKDGTFSVLPKDLPLTLSMTVDDEKGHGRLDIEKLAIGDSNGHAAFQWDATVSPANANGEVAFSTLNLDQLVTDEKKDERVLNSFFALTLPKGVSGHFTATAQKLLFRAPFTNVKAETTLSQGEMVINQASAEMPGQTRLFTFGILKRDAKGMVNYDGNAEMLGEDVGAFMDGVGFKDANIIPATEKQKFRAKANIFLAPRQGTLSELRFQAGDFQFGGGINLNSGGKYDKEITLRFRHANLDPLASFFAPAASVRKGGTMETTNRRLSWLEKVDQKYFLNLLFEDFTFGNRKGTRTQLTGVLQKDRFDAEVVDVNLNDVSIKGSAGFSQTSEIPEINAALSFTNFNLTSFLAEDLIKHPVARGNNQNIWSNAKLNFDYLRGYSGKFDLRVDKALHPDFSIDDLHIVASANKGDWTVDSLTGNIWGGTLSASMHFQALTVPALNSTFFLTNVQAEQMFKSLAGFDALRGNTSISGEFETSGVTAQDWVRNAGGAMSFRGDNFAVRGFDLAGLVQAIPSVRLVADVVNTSRLAALKGQSTFIVVEGGFYFDQGQMATKGITFRSRQAIGKFQGGLDLIHWLMDAGIDFKLITLATQEYPSVRITFQDSMDDLVIGLDTRSLESFVARRKLQ